MLSKNCRDGHVILAKSSQSHLTTNSNTKKTPQNTSSAAKKPSSASTPIASSKCQQKNSHAQRDVVKESSKNIKNILTGQASASSIKSATSNDVATFKLPILDSRIPSTQLSMGIPVPTAIHAASDNPVVSHMSYSHVQTSNPKGKEVAKRLYPTSNRDTGTVPFHICNLRYCSFQ